MVRNGEVWVDGGTSAPCEQGNQFNRDPRVPSGCCSTRARSASWTVWCSVRATLIPLSVYLKEGRMKLELGLCKGKQLHDKRDDMAKKDAQREIQRAFRDAQKR